MLAAFVLAAVQAAPAPTPASGLERTPLERHIDEAELIVMGTVVSVHQGTQVPPRASSWPVGPVPIAEIEVHNRLLADPALERVFVIAARASGSHVEPLLAAGDTGVFFLDADKVFATANPRTVKSLALTTHGAPLYSVREHGAWIHGEDGELRCRHAPGESNAPIAMPLGLDPRKVPIVSIDMLRWVAVHLDAVTPRLSITHVTTGPYGWSALVEADGTWHVADARWPLRAEGETVPPTDGRLGEAELEALHAALDPALFATLPHDIGGMKSPDDGFLVVTLRSRRGVARVRVFSADDPDADPEQAAVVVAARAHLARIAAGLPGDTRPLARFVR